MLLHELVYTKSRYEGVPAPVAYSPIQSAVVALVTGPKLTVTLCVELYGPAGATLRFGPGVGVKVAVALGGVVAVAVGVLVLVGVFVAVAVLVGVLVGVGTVTCRLLLVASSAAL